VSGVIDRATVFGLTAIAGLLLWLLFAGSGHVLDLFWRTPSLALVLGGTLLATMVAYPVARFRSLGKVVRNAFVERSESPEQTIAILVTLAEMARRDGLLVLEKPIEQIDNGFLKRAMRMAVDGMDARMIESVMQAELEGIDLRHTCGKGLLDSMGRFAPVFGMIGTLIGLVIMLGGMSDPTMIGPGMAVALLTTLYGLVFANAVCHPLANKLAQRSSDELLTKTIALKGVLAIQAGDNPRIVAQKLRAYLPQSDRESEPVMVRERAGNAADRSREVSAGPTVAGDAGERIDRSAA
jgi:chemotaxis protein MotA